MSHPRAFRVHERRSVRLAVTVHHATAGWQREARILNVGLGGACVELSLEDVNVGDRLVLDFVAPTLWDPLPIRARVAWVRPRATANASVAVRALALEPVQFGVAFEHADPPSVLALFDLVGQLASYDA